LSEYLGGFLKYKAMKELTDLEKEILNAIDPYYEDGDGGYMAKAAAEVAKKWIEKSWEKCALIASRPERGGLNFNELMNDKSDWLKSNGII
jgi:hypothetical protein